MNFASSALAADTPFALINRRSRRARRRGRGMAALAAVGVLGLASGIARAQETFNKVPPANVDLTKEHTLYVIGYSHLDTEWCWNYPQVISEFIPNTLHENFALFEKYPNYEFNWTGANRYRFMKEYYPADYAKLKEYVAKGRWFPNGSSIEEGDVNNPSSESLIRQVLYGNQFFQREFGTYGSDYMLPDCFGFPASLPSILVHAGVKGFSTQKLSWGSAVGIPFNVGVWTGPDGQGVLAALNGGSYTNQFGEDLSKSKNWYDRVDADGKQSGLFVDYIYYGKGDRGGSAGEGTAPWIERSIVGAGPLKVISGRADAMFNKISPEQAINLPHYKGDLELTQHSAGSLTSEAYMKRWNRKNEILADDAERASVAASLLGAQPYPMARINDAWWRFLPGQFHDLMAGTALPQSYTYSWNDEVIAMNEFAGVLSQSVGGVTRALNTQVKGIPIVVYNPLSVAREDVVEATISTVAAGPNANSVRIIAPDGDEVPAQIIGLDGKNLKIIFLAKAPSVGYAVYNVLFGTGGANGGNFQVSKDAIENERYRVKLDANGDVASIFDKKAKQELLSAPARLAFQYENPSAWPAWNMDWDDQNKPPRAYVDGKPDITIVENGPVRVALQVTRMAQGSKFVQTIRLAAGEAGDRVEFANHIDWKSQEYALKAVFPLAVSNPMATYNWGIGTIERDNNNPKRYEAASHQWFDLTDTTGKYGATVLSDCKNGSDKPDDHTLRLTLLDTPGTRGGYQHQGTQDWGKHDILYGLSGHAGDWRAGNSQWQAARLDQPMVAFQAPSHPGALGKSFSLANVSTAQVQIEALKRAEDSDEIVVRFNELSGQAVKGVRLTMAAPILSAREVNGQEKAMGPATTEGGALVFDMDPYRPRAFALKLGKAPAHLTAPTGTPVSLPYNAGVASGAGKTNGNFDGHGRSFPAEMLPATLESNGITFKLASGLAKNAVACSGQSLSFPQGEAGRKLYFLAASSGGDTPATFQVGGKSVGLTVQSWNGFVGQWDTREWGGVVPELTYGWTNPLVGLRPGYIKRDTVAWYSDHYRKADGTNDPYQFCYLFRYALDIPTGATTVTLPNNPKIRILAATLGRNPNEDTVATEPLYDTLADHTVDSAPAIVPAGGTFSDATMVSLTTPLYFSAANDLRYTLDGSTPTAASPAYTGALSLNQPATLKVRQVSANGALSPVATARFEVTDTTPPSIVKAGVAGLSSVKVVFSEAVTRASAEDTAHYAFDPATIVRSASLGADGRTVVLALGSALSQTGSTSLKVTGVRDLSPAGNATAGITRTLAPLAPVFASAAPRTFKGAGRGFTADAVANLPIAADAPWTINLWAYTTETPGELAVLGGFGDASDTSGTQRFLIKFQDGIHFWGSNIDIPSGVPYDLNRWQMITATYDGTTVRLYKDGKEIKSAPAAFSAALPVVKVGTAGPWDNGHRFTGKIAGFTIWEQALSPDFLKTLLGKGPGSS